MHLLQQEHRQQSLAELKVIKNHPHHKFVQFLAYFSWLNQTRWIDFLVAGLTISFKCNGDFYGWILKVAGHPQLREGRSPYRTPNLDLDQCDLVSRRFYKTKVLVNVPYSAWTQGQGYPNILLVSNPILTLNTIFNTYLFNQYLFQTAFASWKSSRSLTSDPPGWPTETQFRRTCCRWLFQAANSLKIYSSGA